MTPSATQLAVMTRLAGALSVVAALLSACGGQSFSEAGGAGSSHQGGSSSVAGTQASGGSAAHAGSASGGTASGGGTDTAGTGNGGGVSAGAAGSAPGDEKCNAPPVTGMCDAAFQAWYHEPATGLCKPFIYGGCGGNQNRYDSLEACQAACASGGPNYDACKQPSDCQVSGQSCCGVCDGPGITAHDLIAFNKQYAAQATPCANADIACGACPAPLPGQATLKYFVPNCVQGRCVVDDIRESDVTACKVASDCKLRNGNACCSACNVDAPLAVRQDGSFENLVCGVLRPPCAACPPPPGSIAICGASGHCEVEYLAAGQTL